MPFRRPEGVIDFKFELDPYGTRIELPSLVQTLSVSFAPSWSTHTEVGRADPKVLYESFSKNISLAFKVVAEGKSVSPADTFRNLEILSKTTTPNYNGIRSYQGNFVIFTIGRIFIRQVGYITNLQYNWNNTEVTWDVGSPMSGGEGSKLPMWTDVTMDIAWIGSKMPKSTNKYFLEP